MRASNIEKAYKIIENYNGDNNQINYYKILHKANKIILKEYDIEYILKNFNYVTKEVNKVINISSDFGLMLKEKYNIDFLPEKIKIYKIIGEMGNSYHCYAQFRKSISPQLIYINKKYLLNPLFVKDYNKMDIDFDKYDKKTEYLNRKIKEHQKIGVKFLLTNKKCILADSMGLGKTSTATLAAIEGGFKKVLIITMASLKSTWKREISLYCDESEITIINGNNWDNSGKFTIINYDILQNFYEIAEEPVFEEQIILGKNGEKEALKIPVMVKSKSTGKLVQKMKKSRKKSDILKALHNSTLFLSKFDCLIIDEAQKLSNNSSIRYKVIDDFIHKSNLKAIFLVTGTPLTNRPINLYHILRLIDAEVAQDYQYYAMRYCCGKKFKLRSGKEIITTDGATNLNELREKIKHIYIRRLQSEIPGMVNKNVITKYYDLNDLQKYNYNKLWEEYSNAQSLKGNNDSENYRQLVEGMLVRQFLAKEMTKNTIDLVDEQLENNEKVIIICTFQEEIEIFKKYYSKKSVVFDGDMTPKQKEKAEYEFMNNPSVKVFIGQIIACGVGLTLTVSKFLVFNSYSWVAADNLQAQDRIYRITQKEDVTCVYQLFTDSISQDMFEKVMRKEIIMNKTIKSENEKK